MIQPSSAFFMEQVFSILRACLDERQETCYSDRIRASALLKYNRGRKNIYIYIYCIRGVLPCTELCCILQFPVLNLVFQYYCGGVNPVERVRGPTVSLGGVGPREFDLLTPAAQHK